MTKRRRTRRRRITSLCFMIGLVTVSVVFHLTAASSSAYDVNEDDEYVRQVLEEDQYYYDEYAGYYDEADSNGRQDQQEEEDPMMKEEKRRQNEQEQRAQQEADRIAAERERKFQAELDKMNEDQRKMALKQKKRDHRRVQAILKAAKYNNLYGVLGMNNWNIRIEPKIILLGRVKITIPGITIKETTEKDIRKRFRIQAMLVHPDKNKDGRAQEAFIAVETAAAILSDKQQRAMYDEEMKLVRKQQLAAGRQLVHSTVASALFVIRQVIKAAHTILGPFFTPVLIIAALII